MNQRQGETTQTVDVRGVNKEIDDDTLYACCIGCRTTVTASRARERCPICQRVINPKGAQ